MATEDHMSDFTCQMDARWKRENSVEDNAQIVNLGDKRDDIVNRSWDSNWK